jgi:hypothetical protein
MLLGAILKVGLVAQPGSTYAYSNVGYLILGQVIEAVAGEPYETACARRVLDRAGIEQARLDDKWGPLLHATSGWALSGPEFLAFVRFLSLRRNQILSPQSHAWLRSPEGRWISERSKNAYTLGVRLQRAGNSGFDILHTGGWLWHGKYSERSGVYFVLRRDDVAWFASYDGVTGSSDAAVIAELHDALWQAARSASSWPSHDLFGSMGIPSTTERRGNAR